MTTATLFQWVVLNQLDVISVPISWVTPLPEIWGTSKRTSTEINVKVLEA